MLDEFAPYALANGGARDILFDGPIEIPTLGATFRDFDPGDSGSITVNIDALKSNNAFFSLAFMILPSNDAFWANDDAAAYRLFNSDGSFNGIDFTILGSDIYDLGTEVTDEVRNVTAALDQQFPNLGAVEGSVIANHHGYRPPNGVFADGGVLDDPRYANAQFTLPGDQVACVTPELVSPLPFRNRRVGR